MKHLFEVVYTKIEEDTKTESKPRLYQIPADNEINAAAQLGQIFHSEDYTLNIISIRKC